MYNNIAARMHKMAEADFKTDLISYFYTKLKEMLGLSSASQCCWTVIGVREYAEMWPIYNCLSISISLRTGTK